MRVLSQSEIDKLLSNLLTNPTILPNDTSIENKDKKDTINIDNNKEIGKNNIEK